MSNDFEEFEKQFEERQDYTEVPAALGEHIFQLWEHLAVHFVDGALQGRQQGSQVDAGTYMLPNGTTLTFLFRDHHNLFAWAQYPADVVEAAVEQVKAIIEAQELPDEVTPPGTGWLGKPSEPPSIDERPKDVT